MIVLEASQTLQGVAAQATNLTYSIFGMELDNATKAEEYKVLAQGQLPSSAGALYTVPSGKTAFIKGIHLWNAANASRLGIKLFIGGTSAVNQITGSLTFGPRAGAIMEENGWVFHDTAGAQKQARKYV